ncbi:MAG: hydroxyethylthiazole kinase [Kineosporiaceae bacterium]
MTSGPVTPDQCGEALEALRTGSPLVQCLTNIVVAQWTANVLLAVGAAPAMVDNPREAGLFAGVAGGVLINLGTPYETTVAAMRAAADAADKAGTPWVLDPVAAGGLPWRTEVAHELVALHPTIVRGNASEVLALTGGAGGRGVDAVDTPQQAAPGAAQLATKHGSVIAVSGPIDLITDGERTAEVSNGHAWLTKVTGAGCSLGALMAAFAAVVEDKLVAATAATAALTVAADAAAAATRGPGSFAVALLDELSLLTPQRLAEQVRLG